MYRLENHFNHNDSGLMALPDAWDHALLMADDAAAAASCERFTLGDWQFEPVSAAEPVDLSDISLTFEPARVAFVISDLPADDPLLDILRGDGIEIVRITAGRNAEQISNYLYAHDRIDSIHIIAGQPTPGVVREPASGVLPELPEETLLYHTIGTPFVSGTMRFFVEAPDLTMPAMTRHNDCIVSLGEAAAVVHSLSFTIRCFPPGEDAATEKTVKYRYFTPDGAVNRLDLSLLNGHAGLGNDGRRDNLQSLHANAIEGTTSLDGVSFCPTCGKGEGIFSHGGTKARRGEINHIAHIDHVEEEKPVVNSILRLAKQIHDTILHIPFFLFPFSFFLSPTLSTCPIWLISPRIRGFLRSHSPLCAFVPLCEKLSSPVSVSLVSISGFSLSPFFILHFSSFIPSLYTNYMSYMVKISRISSFGFSNNGGLS